MGIRDRIMYKYAEIYGGRVRDIKTSHLDFINFSSIWSPNSFWVDVTGVDVEIGYVVKSDTKIGVYFERPEVLIDESSFDFQKQAKMELLSATFSKHDDKARIMTSLGFRVNAGERAKQDINGLVITMEADKTPSIEFMDFDNILQLVTLDELKTIQVEVIKNSSMVYQQKWEIRDRIQSAETVEELDAIDISFHDYNFMLDEPLYENYN